MTRIFIGLEIPQDIKHSLLSLQTEMPGFRWQTAEQMHLTLRFLGEVEKKYLPQLAQAMRKTLMPAFELSVHGSGCFNRNTKPIILWAGIRPLEPVTTLYERLSEQLQAQGFDQEEKGFIPHITIARLKRSANVESFIHSHEEFSTGPFPISHISLFSSTAGPDGSQYLVLYRSSLESGETILHTD